MREIAELHAAVKPVETLFVVDAMQGQDAVNTARAFREALPLTGVILTKLDGDARGGAALSVRHVTGAPIKFAGVSEKIDGLETFHPERMASRILGMGDVLTLIEEAHKTIDVEEAQKLAKKVKSGKGFDLEDYKAQIAQMRKMGGLSAMLDKLPAELAPRRAGHDDEREEDRPGRGHHQLDDARGAGEARAAQGVAQAPDRRRARGVGPGGQPAAQPVRADAESDENGGQGRNAEDAAWNEGFAARAPKRPPATTGVDAPRNGPLPGVAILVVKLKAFLTPTPYSETAHHGRHQIGPRRRQEAPVLQYGRRGFAQLAATAASSSVSASTIPSPRRARKHCASPSTASRSGRSAAPRCPTPSPDS